MSNDELQVVVDQTLGNETDTTAATGDQAALRDLIEWVRQEVFGTAA